MAAGIGFSRLWHGVMVRLRQLRPLVLAAVSARERLRALRRMLRLAGKRRQLFAVNIAVRAPRVVFVAERPTWREAKLAFGLKRAGWGVSLLHVGKPAFSDMSSFCEVRECFSPGEAVEEAHHMKSRLFHVFSINSDPTTEALMKRKPGRAVIDFYDDFLSIADGLPKLEFLYSYDIASQRACVAAADAICCRDPQLQYRRDLRPGSRGKPLILFPEYCWDTQELPPRPVRDEIHIAQIGWMGLEARGQFDVGCFPILKNLVEGGCHLHIYLHRAFPQLGTLDFTIRFADYLELGAKTGRVNIRANVPSAQLVQEISQFDYGFGMSNGLIFPTPWTSHNPRRFPYCGSARLYDCLEAGMGFLLNREHRYMLRTFSPYGVALDATEAARAGDIGELRRKRLSRDAALVARRHFSIDRNIHRLTEFYTHLL